MATKNTTTNTESLESKTANAIKTAKDLYMSLVPVYGTDAIQVKDSDANDLLLGTRKLKVQVEIALGKDVNSLELTQLLPVTISKQFEKETVMETIHLPVMQLLLAGSNGLFELYNTNPKDKVGFDSLSKALVNGYFYPSSFEQANKKEPFSFAALIGIINVMAEKNQLTESQVQQWTLVKAKCPKVKELSDFLVVAYKSPKWIWLAELMDGNGYVEPTIDDSMESLL